MSLPSIAELNELGPSELAATLAPLFEGAPRFLGRLADARPFESDEALIGAAREVAASAPQDELIELLDAHPRIGAATGVMSPLSQAEQDDGAPDEGPLIEELAMLNDVYESRFGFRYVVFVAGRPRAAIAPLIETAIRNEREAELRRGVADAIYIAADRLLAFRGLDSESMELDS